LRRLPQSATVVRGSEQDPGDRATRQARCDQGQKQDFNTARVEALELDNLIETAKASIISAEARQESRGAQARSDFPDRDDVHWLKTRCGIAMETARVQARAAYAAHGRVVPAQDAHVLTRRSTMKFRVYRYDRTRIQSRACRTMTSRSTA